MKRTGSALLAASVGTLLAPTVFATGVVKWDIEKRHHPKSSLGKRASGTQQEDVVNSVARGGYFATCTLGTPSQDVILQLDTGSSDIWVPSSDAAICSVTEEACSLGTCAWKRKLHLRSAVAVGLTCDSVVNPNASSTFVDADVEFDISYVDGSYSKGDYFRDTFQIANATVANMTMGLGIDTTITYGLLGVGYASNEAIISTEESLDAQYDNLPALMMKEGLIATNAYSLWLNDLDSSTGNILFGGIDTSKYVGSMTRIPTIRNNATGEYDSFIVGLTSVRALSSSGTDTLTSHESPIEVVLDSGTTLSYLPTDIASQIWEEVGALYSASYGLAVIPCKMQTSTGYFSFQFGGPGGPVVNVTMDELVLDLVVQGPAPKFGSGEYAGEDACEFGIQNTTGTNLLGDTFLRSAYVVYDLVNNQIGIAQTDFNETESAVVAFESKGAVIPSATLVSNQSLVSSTASFTTPAFAAETGFSNGTESSASLTDVPALFGMSAWTLTLAIVGGAVWLL